LANVPIRVVATHHDTSAAMIEKHYSSFIADWPKWLGEEQAMEAELSAMLKPCLDEALKIWPVGKAVGNVKNKRPQLITTADRGPELSAGKGPRLITPLDDGAPALF